MQKQVYYGSGCTATYCIAGNFWGQIFVVQQQFVVNIFVVAACTAGKGKARFIRAPVLNQENHECFPHENYLLYGMATVHVTGWHCTVHYVDS